MREYYLEENDKTKGALRVGSDEIDKLIDTKFNLYTRKNNIDTNSNKFLFIEDMKRNLQENIWMFGSDAEKIINQSVENLEATISDIEGKGISLDEIIKPNFDDFEETMTKLRELKAGLVDAQDPMNMIYDALIAKHYAAYNAIKNAPIQPFEFTKDVMNPLQSLISGISDLDSAYRTLADGEELTMSTTIDLLSKHPDLIKTMRVENGVLKVTGQSIKDVAKAREIAFREDIEQKRQQRVAALETAKKQIQANNEEIESLQKKLTALNEANKIIQKMAGNTTSVSNSMFVDPKTESTNLFGIPNNPLTNYAIDKYAQERQAEVDAQAKLIKDAQDKLKAEQKKCC